MPSLETLLATLLSLGALPAGPSATDDRSVADAAAERAPEPAIAPPPSATADVSDPAELDWLGVPGRSDAVDSGTARPPAPARPSAELAAAPAPAKKPRKTWVAVQSDIGLPDGLGVTAVVTPVEQIRLELGAIGNGLNAGVRGGVTFLPRLWAVRPTLSFDAGRIFSGDANGAFGALLPAEVRPMLQGIAWNFASARLGLEFGTRRGAVQVQGGMGWVDVEAPGLSGAVVQGLGGGTRIQGGAPHVQMWAPSLRVGLIVALF